jgi:hypothetical protein
MLPGCYAICEAGQIIRAGSVGAVSLSPPGAERQYVFDCTQVVSDQMEWPLLAGVNFSRYAIHLGGGEHLAS